MFLNGILTGVLVGVAFMYLWRKLMREKQQERFLRAMDNESLRTIQKAEHFDRIIKFTPKWIQFGNFEQVEWLNQQLKELWPYVNKAVQGTIEETVEPMLKGYTGGMIASMEFTRTDLGNKSPRILGVQVTSLKHNQLALDMDIKWNGNCMFKLAIVTAARASVKPCVQDLSFVGTVRVILELTDKVPVVAAYMATITRKTGVEDFDVDFKLTGSGLGVIRGLEDKIEAAIESSVANMMLWPNRITGCILEGYNISHLEFRYSGAVVVTVLKCEGLKNMDTLGKSDPRVLAYCRTSHMFETRVVDNSLNPQYNETFEIPVDDVHTADLHFEVQDEDDMGVAVSWESMGFASMPMEDVFKCTEETTWTLPLFNSLKISKRTDESFGTVTFSAVYRSYGQDEAKEVTETEAKWLPNKTTKCLTPDEAKAAKAKALEDAQGRAQNRKALKGAAFAAGALIGLKKGTLDPLTPSPATAAGPTDLMKAPSAPAPGVAKAASAFKAASTPAPAPAAAEDPAVKDRAALFRAAASSAGAVAAAQKEVAAPAPAPAPAPVPAAPHSLQLPTPSEEPLLPKESGGSPPLLAPPSPARSHTGAIHDNERGGSKHRVSGFFRGAKAKMQGAMHMSMDTENASLHPSERPPTPGSATPRRGGVFSAFKKDKKPAEV